MTYPEELTAELQEVLGWTLMKCGTYAPVFRANGYDIPRKAEAEQAFLLHWLIKLVLQHGAKWRDQFTIQLIELTTSPRPVSD